jgi:hypothetical protein
MYCNQCGTELRDGFKFCGECGAAVGSSKPKVSIDSKPLNPGKYQSSAKPKFKLSKIFSWRFFAISFFAVISGVIILFVIHSNDKVEIKVINLAQNTGTDASPTTVSDPEGWIDISENNVIQSQEGQKQKISGAVVSIVNNGKALRIGENTVELYGYEPSTAANLTNKLMEWIKSLNTTVECIPKKQKFICYTKDNIDIVQAAILNGVGMASLGAPNIYLEAEKNARSKRKGMWE